jgi:hypothetical protein
MSKKFHIVLTTIYNPLVLVEYTNNFIKFNKIDQVKLWVVADRKTPKECLETLKNVMSLGLDVEYISLERQLEWGKNHEDFYNSLPFDNDTRRNIGYLMALEDGCEVLISIDDDNWPTDDDFIGFHSIVGGISKNLVHEHSGYHNICEYIEFVPNRSIYPRGYPFNLRDQKNQCTLLNGAKKIGVNAGLWLESPDIDATTWLNGTISGITYSGPDSFCLDNNTWSPVNTQNTAIIRELIPYYFCVPMGFKVPGGIIHRYGDIWGGYLLLALIDNSDYVASFGRPIALHKRNPHNYLTDLRQEYWGIILTDWLLSHIKSINYSSSDLNVRSAELCDMIDRVTDEALPDWCPTEVKIFLKETVKSYRIYIKTANKLV